MPRASEDDAEDLAPAPAPEETDGGKPDRGSETGTTVVSGEPVDLTKASVERTEDEPEPIKRDRESNHDDGADDDANADDPDSDADREEFGLESERNHAR